MRAIISVSDKTGIVEFAAKLAKMGVEIISTGNTSLALSEAGITNINVSDVTGYPECLDGRVKTLHPNLFAGILAVRDNEQHVSTLKELNVNEIDFVIVNLYPFKKTIQKENVQFGDAIENIDIGGPSLLRAAAKNHAYVTVIVDPSDYDTVINELEQNSSVSDSTRFSLASKVFEHTAHYDSLISGYFRKLQNNPYPKTLSLTYEKLYDMRYGENPHQSAAFYKETGDCEGTLTSAVQLHGKELSFNNINDTHGALELLKEFDEPAVVACKHSNPCGVGCADNLYEAYMKAYKSDPVSVFGGIIVCNREVDVKIAQEINKIFIEIVAAPSFTDEALSVLKSKKNIRLLQIDNITKKSAPDSIDVKKVSGGIIVQNIDSKLLNDELSYVTNRKPTEKEMNDLLFTWKIVKYVKSNGIAIGRDNQSVGIGPGQVNRIWACQQAIQHGIDNLGADALRGAVLASDAYFPFEDCVTAAAEAGITAIIQPGGSINDAKSIEACNKHNIAMVFTGMRHFRH